MEQRSLVNARKRAVLPVVRERTQLADSLARNLLALGLERRVRPEPSLKEYVRENYRDADRTGVGTTKGKNGK